MAAPADDNDLRVLIRSGTRALDGRGRIVGFSPPLLNNQGQVLVSIEIDDPRADMYDAAILVTDPAGRPRQLLRTGQSLPDGERFGWIMNPDQLVFNNAGQAALWSINDDEWNERSAIYRIEPDDTFVAIYNVADHDTTQVGRPLLNNRGQIVFEAWEDGDYERTISSNVYRVDPDGTRVRLFGSGDPAPDGEYRLSSAIQLGSTLTDTGWVTFFASPNPVQPGGSPTNAFYRSDGSGLVELARRGQPAVETDEQFEGLHHSRYSTLDDSNRAVFYGRTRMLRPPYSTGVLVMHTDAGLVELARQGAGTPHGKTFESVGGISNSINQNGQVAFRAKTSDGHFAIFRAGPDGTVGLVAEAGQPLPGGGRLGGAIAGPVINSQGQVAFAAANQDNQRGVFVGEPGQELRIVVIEGQDLLGTTVRNVEFAGNAPGRSGFNDPGQVAIKVRLMDGNDDFEAIIVIEPGSY